MISKKMIIAGIAILLIAGVSNALFSNSHNVYKNETSPQDFCGKCHKGPAEKVNVSAHSNATCICHGYNPNATAEYNVNMTHTLTKDIYCTNCHSKYNETTGEIPLSADANGANQSAHYIMNRSDTQLLNNSRGFFQ